jgi:hypothetical protein
MTERQSWGEIKEGLGAPIRRLLEARRGQPTIVRLANREELLAYDTVWGRDFGDLWEHVTINGSPPQEGRPIHFLYLSEVVHVLDAETGCVLIDQEPAPGET